MKISHLLLGAVAVTAGLASQAPAVAAAPTVPTAPIAQSCPAYLDHDFRQLHSSKTINLCKAFPGKPLLIVNTASHCGFTPQFKGLESVYQKYKARGLVVVGFSSNDFAQEDADEAVAAETCFLNNGVTFTMLAPQKVKGPDANPVFKELNKQSSEPKWNFNKYLVARDGTVAKYYDSKTTPESAEFNAELEKLVK
ncbi:MAG: glutathione peroxidase [Steroidobacteraceae bacterium]